MRGMWYDLSKFTRTRIEQKKAFQPLKEDELIMKKIGGFLAKSNDWNSFFKKRGSSWRDKDYEYLNSVLDISNLEGIFLDIGCALGDGIIFLKNKCPHITKFWGTDISAQAISACKRNPMLNDVTFFQHDMMNSLPNSYNIVVCLQMLEHVPNPVKAMKNLINTTDDLLVVSTPYKNRRPDRSHIWSFDENDFRDLVDCYCLGQKFTNIYWLLDKSKLGIQFRRSTNNTFLVETLGQGKHFVRSLLHSLLK